MLIIGGKEGGSIKVVKPASGTPTMHAGIDSGFRVMTRRPRQVSI